MYKTDRGRQSTNASLFQRVRFFPRRVHWLASLVCLLITVLPAQAEQPSQIADALISDFVSLSPKNADELRRYARHSLLPHIDLEQMAIGLCGRSQWSAWNTQEKSELINALGDTLVRYVYEAGEAYRKQRLSVVSEQETSLRETVVRVAVSDDFLPTVTVDLFLQNNQGEWLARDFAVAGISYVKMKRAQYKTLIAFGGLPALIEHLKGKNNELVRENHLSRR